MSTLRAKRPARDDLRIPTLPPEVVQINERLDDPEAGLADVGEIIAGNAPLTAEILRIANSSYFGLRERCVSAKHATTILGPRVIRNIVMQASVLGQFEHLRGHPGFDMDELWRHSVLTAQACQLAATRSTRALALTPEEFYVCGLLHDVGQMILLDNVGDGYLDIRAGARTAGRKEHKGEREAFGYDHAEVGAVLAARWELPLEIVEAIRYHHGPRERVAADRVVSLVANANLLVERVLGGDIGRAGTVIDADTASQLGLEPEDARWIVEQVVALRETEL